MMKRVSKLLAGALIALALASCNLPAAQQNAGPATGQQAATIAAATVSAALTSAAVTPFASPAAPATPAASPTEAKIILSINTNSNCRSGPGGSFKVVTSFGAGASLEVSAKSTDNNYWLVKIPNSTDTCWVSGADGTTTGNTASLPEATPASAASGLPAKPGALHYSYSCTASSISVSLSWVDAATNESGYHVYRSGTQIADLPANSTSYDDNIMSGPPQDLQYSVAAYNDAGESPQRLAQFTACP
jgi:hypothetical protein